MYKVRVNDDKEIAIAVSNNGILIDGKPVAPDRLQTKGSRMHMLHENKSYRIEVIELNAEEKTAWVRVNGNRYQVKISDRYDALLKSLGMEASGSGGSQEIKAPMPGMVLNVIVEEGQEVQKNDPLLILEAMKMENVLKAPTAGKVSELKVKAGDKVEKGFRLLALK